MPELDDLPKSYIAVIISWLNSREDDNATIYDLQGVHVKKSLQYVYPLFLLIHVAVALVSICSNTGMISDICRKKLYRGNQQFIYLLNLCFSDLIKCLIVLPLTLPILLIDNWRFGSFLCYFLPMLQSFPIHSSMLTFLVIGIDRFRYVIYPIKPRIPAGLCVIAVWVISICIVLPYAVYIKFISLEKYLGPELAGIGICLIASGKDIYMEEYIRAIFVIMYALPLAIIAFLYVRVSAELKSREYCNSFQSNTAKDSSGSWTTSDSDPLAKVEVENQSEGSRGGSRQPLNMSSTEGSHDDIDVPKEKRSQNYLISMVTLFAICWCPLNVLSLVSPATTETVHNASLFDITYITFVWFGFLSTCVNPILFASWRMSDSTKDRLRGYFRFSNRSNRRDSNRTASGVYAPSPRVTRRVNDKNIV